MWICHNKGLFSIVNYVDPSGDTGTVLLRTRSKKHIPEVFPKYANDVEHTPRNDYAYRVRVHKNNLAGEMSRLLWDINYPNFKASVDDHDLSMVYSNFWNDARWNFGRY